MDILEYIPKGKENAISTQTLMKVFNCSMREIRLVIASARNNGAVICSFSGGGYYYPLTREELSESINTLQGKANSIYIMLHSQKKALAECEGQETLKL